MRTVCYAIAKLMREEHRDMTKAPLGTFAENMSNADEILEIFITLTERCAVMMDAYVSARQIYGKDHATTKNVWDLYLATDEEAHPYRVAIGQVQMQQQRDAGATPVNED